MQRCNAERRTQALSLAIAVVAIACSESHERPRTCDPMSPISACEADEVCRPTWEDEWVCMRTCFEHCETGEACVARRPEAPPFVCWPGGPEPRGASCSHSVQCARGHYCNAQNICEEACDSPEFECSTTGLRCTSYRVCQVPIPPGTACSAIQECDPYHVCDPETLFTCQPKCPPSGECPDRSACDPASGERCPIIGELPRFDECARTGEDSVGCAETETCVMTTVGVRRCVVRGCEPGGTGEPCLDRVPCLPDPENPAENVCWPGGALGWAEPCTSSYECRFGLACNSVGVCTYACMTEGEPCGGGLVDHVCRDHVCSPAAP